MTYNHYVFTHTLTILNNLDKEKARLTGGTSTFLTEKKSILKQLNCSLYSTRLFSLVPVYTAVPLGQFTSVTYRGEREGNSHFRLDHVTRNA